MCNILGPDGFEGKYKIIRLKPGVRSEDLDLDPDDYMIYSARILNITSTVNSMFGGDKYGTYLKMYGKSVSKPQRKIGHFNVVDLDNSYDVSELLKTADEIKNSILVTPLD
jgi:5-(carboxyamino)imidazole ribonucleotide synthase